MRITIRTKVNQPYQQVWENFGEKLFKALNPPFPPVKLLRFDGSLKGDEVHLELSFLLFKQVWISKITDQQTLPNEIFFVDEGIKLPFFLKSWHHKHRIVQDGSGTVIIDEISFKTPFLPFDFLMLPAMYGQFAYRVPIYKRFFH
jgi:ligand-binding SRPBCC domain-containing protein